MKMKLSEALRRMQEIERAREDLGEPAQYDSPELPGEYDDLIKRIEAAIESQIFVEPGPQRLAWHLGPRGLMCSSVMEDEEI